MRHGGRSREEEAGLGEAQKVCWLGSSRITCMWRGAWAAESVVQSGLGGVN